jgi:CO/xanthine dehydrogenase Mo-binding subunit
MEKCYFIEERIVFRQGRVFVEGDPENGVSLQALAARAVATLGHPIVGEMTTMAEAPDVTAYCAQVAVVEVDPETGQVVVHRIVTAHDVGTIINPLDHQGQIDGAVMQGLGYALMEGLQSEDGHISTLSLGEAALVHKSSIAPRNMPRSCLWSAERKGAADAVFLCNAMILLDINVFQP